MWESNNKVFDTLENYNLSLEDRLLLTIITGDNEIFLDVRTLEAPVTDLALFKKDKNAYWFIQNGEVLVWEHADFSQSLIALKKTSNLRGEHEIFYYMPPSK